MLIGILAFGLLAYWFGSPVGSRPQTQTAAETVKLDPDAVDGHVLPFQIIGAMRNFGVKDGMVDAQISASVEGGSSADWMATAVYIAEHSIVNGATFSEVELYVPNPWGDNPPIRVKMLSKVYYAPDPSRSPWSDKVWSIFTADRRPTLADIEYDRMDAADARAQRIVVRKYKLSPKWKPSEGLGLTGVEYGRGHIRIVGTDGIEDSMSALAACLSSESGPGIFKGCLANRANR